MLEKGKVDALFVLKRMEEYQEEKSLYTCFADVEKAFGRVSKKVVK